MPEFITSPPIIALAVIAGVVLPWITFTTLRAHRRHREHREALARITALDADLKALCTSITGFGQRLATLEQQLRGIEERQMLVELHDNGDRSLNQAIRLANQGADTDILVHTCGLNRGEAELLMRLHGH